MEAASCLRRRRDDDSHWRDSDHDRGTSIWKPLHLHKRGRFCRRLNESNRQRVDGLIGHGTYPGGKVTTVNQNVTISWMAWMKSFRLTGLVT